MRLLRGLDADCAPDLPPHIPLESLVFSDLREKVTSAIREARRWKKPESLQYSACYELQLEPLENGSELPMSAARLLPGKKELLVLNYGRIELWSVEPPTCIWQAPPFLGQHCCSSFDFDIVEDGKMVMVVGEFIVPDQSTTYVCHYSLTPGLSYRVV